MNTQPTSGAGPGASASDRSLGNIVYGLYAGALLFPILAVAAVIVDYVKQEEVRGTLLESHIRWQIRTFWFTLLWAVIGALLWIVVIGWFIVAAATIWYIYRIAKGWLRLSEGKAVELP